MPKVATTVSVEDKARAFLSNGWTALYSSEDDSSTPRVMDKQVVYLRGLSKKKSRAGLSDEQVRIVQRLVKGEGTKEEASEVISVLTKQDDGADTIDQVAAVEEETRDLGKAQAEVKELLAAFEEARATYDVLSNIAVASDPDACVYCDKTEDEHPKAMHDFEGPEPEAVLAYAAQSRMVIAEVALTKYLAQF